MEENILRLKMKLKSREDGNATPDEYHESDATSLKGSLDGCSSTDSDISEFIPYVTNVQPNQPIISS